MGEIAEAWVSIYPKFTDGFGTQIQQETQQSVDKALASTEKSYSAAGKSSGKKFGDRFGSEVEQKAKEAVGKGAGSAATTAGKSSGKKFGEAFISASQKVVNFLAIAGAVGSQFQTAVDKSEGSVSSMSAATALAGTSMGALNAEFGKVQSKLFVFQTGSKAASSFGDALKQVVNNSKGFDGFGTQLNGFLAGLVGTKTAAGELAGQVGKLDQALAGVDSSKAAAAFASISAAAREQGIGVDDLIKLFPEYKASLQNVVAAFGIAEPSAQEYAEWMGGKIPAAIIEAANANPKLAEQLGITTSSMVAASNAANENATATKGAATATETYLDKITRLANKQLELSGSQIGYEAALDDATESLKKNGRTLDIHTEKGRANRQALNDIASSAIAVAQGMKDAGKSDDAVSDKMETMRANFIKTAEKMGLTADEAKRLADKLGLIKDKHVTVDVKIKVRQTGEVDASSGLKVYVTGNGRKLMAGGGAVFGGIPGRDSVPALLMPDEHVLTTDDVRNLGGHRGVFRMRALAQQGALRFATGGPVMPSYGGHSLDWWQDKLLSDLDLTRLQIQIRDLQSSLVEKETYNPPGKRKRATRLRLRGLDRTEAQQELAEAQERLRLAEQAAQANASVSGSIVAQLASYEKAQQAFDDAASVWQQAASSLGKSAGLGSLDALTVQHSNAMGEVWSTRRDLTAADLASRVSTQAAQVEEFIGLLDDLRRSGASEALISDILSLGTVEGTKAARLFLADATQRSVAEAGYARLASSQARLNAIGAAAGTINVTINEAATPEATKQAVVNGILAART